MRNYIDYIKSEFQKITNGQTIKTLDELARMVIKTIKSNNDTLCGFSWDIRYAKHIYTWHCAPIVEREQRIHDPSRGDKYYPGFSGRVWIRFGERPIPWAFDTFKYTLTYPGTGGFGAYDGPWQSISTFYYRNKLQEKQVPKLNLYSWDYRFFLDDFPDLDEVKHQRLIAILKNERFTMSHHFLWEDPDMLAYDQQLIGQYTKRP